MHEFRSLMKLCSSQAQEALMDLATQTQPLSTNFCEPEEHNTANLVFFLVWSNSFLLSCMTSCICRIWTFLEWNLDLPGMEATCHAELLLAENSCPVGWSFGVMEKSENHSAAQGWSGSTATETDPGLKAEASNKASVFLLSFLLEGKFWWRGQSMSGVYFVKPSSYSEHLTHIGQDGCPYTSVC